MNSKSMINWSGFFLLLSFVIVIYQIVANDYRPEIFYFLIVSTIFNVSSSIMKKLESINTSKE